MIVNRDVVIPSDDIELRADIYRPENVEKAPVIMTSGPYGKGVSYQKGYAEQWKWLSSKHPHIFRDSTRSFLTWETVDPEYWTLKGYSVVRIDCRGSGRTPGYLDIYSPREIQDLYNAIEWAGVQPWSNGRVGLSGISYYAIAAWRVAALQPPHLSAMIVWEGATDFYREFARHGGIASTAFLADWYGKQVTGVQHGNPDGIWDDWLGASATGSDMQSLTKDQLEANRSDMVKLIEEHQLDDEWFRARTTDLAKVKVPLLSGASWAGFGLHSRGNFEGFTQSASEYKWLECHPGRHEEWFYLDEQVDMQKKFLDCFLKGEDNGWLSTPRVIMHVRRPFEDSYKLKQDNNWPLPKTKWTKMHIGNESLTWNEPVATGSQDLTLSGEDLLFHSEPLKEETEMTGPIAAKIWASSSTIDMDLFLTVRAFAPDGREVTFQGSLEPAAPIAQGWLRASHRKLNQALSLPYRPYHAHDEVQPLVPGQIYELDIEVWPTNVVLPAGYTLALQIGAKDFERPFVPGSKEVYHGRGSGPFLHNNPIDRPESVFSGKTTIYYGNDMASYILLPIIPHADSE